MYKHLRQYRHIILVRYGCQRRRQEYCVLQACAYFICMHAKRGLETIQCVIEMQPSLFSRNIAGLAHVAVVF